jgi:chemotaxis protein methyltransferase CheR
MKAADTRFELVQPVVLEEREFERLGKFIMSQFGIKMPSHKKIFLQNRLQKRLRELNIKNFIEYADYIFSPRGQQEELPKMVDAVSTNKTDFFREPVHFAFLLSKGLDDYFTRTGKKSISIWSAGCSSGEEPYTLAMILKEYGRTNLHFDFRILATDISNSVLQHAAVGIYNDNKIYPIPTGYHAKYLQKGTGTYEHKFRIDSDIRNKISFQQSNLLSNDYFGFGKFDIIFCRNVLIYFEREIQYRILAQLCRHLSTGGYLFLGHSESITGLDLPLEHIKPTIFMKSGHLT